MKTKFYGFIVRLHRATEAAVCMSFDHHEYGQMVEIWVPKSNLHPDSLDVIAESADDDEVEVFIAAWWLRKNFGENRSNR